MGNLENISERLAYLLESKKITPYQLSVGTGISESTISRILSQKTKKLQTPTITLLANYLQVKREWLLTGDGDIAEKDQADLNFTGYLSNIDELIKANRDLSASNKILAENNARLTAIIEHLKNANI